ncbi:MAG: hypothetical protein IPF53_10695 [Blastocatellia bacterium]|nr:hypothetical protein [Blastocatellia bacterium]
MNEEKAIVTRGFTCDEELTALVRAFETCEISRGAWDHAGHIAVALVYATELGEDAATDRMRTALLHFTKVNNIVPSPGRGYHETLTRFWMRMVAVVAAELESSEPLHARANAAIERLADKNVAKHYYSPELLASDEARSGFVLPDLAELPTPQQ